MDPLRPLATTTQSGNLVALPLIHRASFFQQSRPRIASKIPARIVQKPWPKRQQSVSPRISSASQPYPTATTSTFEAPPPSSTRKWQSSTPLMTTMTKGSAISSATKKRLRLSTSVLAQGTPSSQKRWRSVPMTPIASSTTTLVKLNPSQSEREEDRRGGDSSSSSTQPRKTCNHLVDLLRFRIAEQQEKARLSNNHASSTSGSSQHSHEGEAALVGGDGFQTPRSVVSEYAHRSSPPRLARSTGGRARMETPVSAARVRIHSPAPSRESIIERVDFVLS